MVRHAHRFRTSRRDPSGFQRADPSGIPVAVIFGPRCGGQFQLSFSTKCLWVPRASGQVAPDMPATTILDALLRQNVSGSGH